MYVDRHVMTRVMNCRKTGCISDGDADQSGSTKDEPVVGNKGCKVSNRKGSDGRIKDGSVKTGKSAQEGSSVGANAAGYS